MSKDLNGLLHHQCIRTANDFDRIIILTRFDVDHNAKSMYAPYQVGQRIRCQQYYSSWFQDRSEKRETQQQCVHVYYEELQTSQTDGHTYTHLQFNAVLPILNQYWETTWWMVFHEPLCAISTELDLFKCMADSDHCCDACKEEHGWTSVKTKETRMHFQ